MPLAHLLAPQIMRRAQEIEADLGRSPTGYLEAKAPPREIPSYDPSTPSGAATQAFSALPQSPGWQAFRAGAQRGITEPTGFMLPNAPVTARPVAKTPTDRRGRIVIPKGARGEPYGFNEAGQAVDAYGRNLGYLNQAALVTPYGDVPMRTAERGISDVRSSERDRFAVETLRRIYGGHLRALQDNRTPTGLATGKFPAGYFKGMSKEKREDIQKGVRALEEIEKGEALRVAEKGLRA